MKKPIRRKSVVFTISMPRPLIARLDRQAALEGRSRSSMLRKIYYDFCVAHGIDVTSLEPEVTTSL